MHPCDQIVILSQLFMMTKIALANLLNIANFRAPPELMCFSLWFLSNVSTYVSDSIHFVLHPLPVR